MVSLEPRDGREEPARAPPPRLRDALARPVRPAACWLALVFWWASIYPTLLPRAWWAQGAVSGIAVDLGIAVGALAASIVAAVLAARGRSVPTVIPRHGRLWFAGAAAVVGLVGMVTWLVWQNDQRRLLGMPLISWFVIPPVLLVGLVVGALFFFAGRLLAHPVRRFDRILRRRVPRVAAHIVTAALVLIVGVTVTRRLVLDPVAGFANDRFGAFDTGTEKGVKEPVSSLRSGGPGSLVRWDSLGYQGRSFIGKGPTQAALQAFAGPNAAVHEPIRVYVGLRAADSAGAQARLAVRELERTGAFDRLVLAVATVTGTGWINPAVADAMEYMYGGDTAIVATQYSYLPSWISFLVDLDKAAKNGRALFDAVHQRWSELPEGHRPRLVAFGESLGSYGSESAFEGTDAADSVSAVATQVEGALWIGPTFANPVWDQIIDSRQRGSPVWRPQHGDGQQVRILGACAQPPADGQQRPLPDVVYLTHPSDPVTWASVDTLWSRPEWMNAPTGCDVPDHLFWFPGVTAAQTVFDLMAGFSAPPGFGHDYGPDIVDGWVALAAPDGWTVADSVRLRTLLAHR